MHPIARLSARTLALLLGLTPLAPSGCGRAEGTGTGPSTSTSANTSPSTSPSPSPSPSPSTSPSPSPSPSASEPGPAPAPDRVRWIALGGGSGPEDNQVQIESDLALAARALGPDGVTLYAAGPATHAVQVEDEASARAAAAADPVVAALGDLLDPRAGRGARYRATTLAVHAEGSLARLTDWLGKASASPLTLVLAGHGAAGATPAENELLLWGGDGLRPSELAPVLAAAGGPDHSVRVVLTSCYSGAFADLVFADADPGHGAARPLRCGFFATSAVRVASGCDPDPERQHTEGYALHFFPALAMQDRDGRPLPARDVDFDGDGHASFAEAHARARIASRGFDVPTATSARWLEVRAPAAGPEAAVAWPEEEAVVAALADRLGLADPAEAARRLASLDATREERAAAAERAQDDEDRLARDAIAELLARWPELGDPWHPGFTATLARARPDLVTWLRESPRYDAYRAAHDVTATRAERADDAALVEAPVERLVQARENLARARRLKARGGPDQAVLDAILACERGP